MKKIELIAEAFVLEKKDEKLIKVCLDYCFHRIVKHDSCGIRGMVDTTLLNKLREELRK